ncbi:MAG TPA: hypothetical protein VNI77_03810 [Nitrososphaera sp.]|nr:hypothetical protein [Nitrososphaera sp.]
MKSNNTFTFKVEYASSIDHHQGSRWVGATAAWQDAMSCRPSRDTTVRRWLLWPRAQVAGVSGFACLLRQGVAVRRPFSTNGTVRTPTGLLV